MSYACSRFVWRRIGALPGRITHASTRAFRSTSSVDRGGSLRGPGGIALEAMIVIHADEVDELLRDLGALIDDLADGSVLPRPCSSDRLRFLDRIAIELGLVAELRLSATNTDAKLLARP